jgi:hypothetical protein
MHHFNFSKISLLWALLFPLFIANTAWALVYETQNDERGMGRITNVTPSKSKPSNVTPSKSKPSISKSNDYFNHNILNGTSSINLVAIKGDVEGAYDILKILSVPLVANGFKDKFYARGDVFDQVIDGRGGAILELELPPEIDKIVFMKIGRLNAETLNAAVVYNNEAARSISREIFISILSRKSGAIIKSNKITVRGAGYSDKATQEAYLEDLKDELQQFHTFFDY